jgi:hypothetical protein
MAVIADTDLMQRLERGKVGASQLIKGMLMQIIPR